MKKNQINIILLILGFQLFAYIADAQLDAPNLLNTFSSNPCGPYYNFPDVSGASEYEIQMSTDANFTEIVYDE